MRRYNHNGRTFERDAALVRGLIREHLPSARIIGEPTPAPPERAADVSNGQIHRIAMSAHDALVIDAMRSHATKEPSRLGYERQLALWSGLCADLFVYAYNRAAEQAQPGRGHLRNAEAAIREYLHDLAADERQSRLEAFKGVDAPAGQWPWEDYL